MRTSSWAGTMIALSLWLGLPPLAEAQDTASITDFSVLRYSPAPGAGNYFQVDGAATPGHLTGSFGVALEYAHQPLVLWSAECDPDGTNCRVTDQQTNLVNYLAVAHLSGSFVLFNHLQISAIVPVVYTEGEGFAFSGGAQPVEIRTGSGFALADPRLHIKGRFFTDPESGVSMGAAAFVTFPTGQAIAANRYVGDGLPTFGGHLILDWSRQGIHLAANIGGLWRENAQLFSTTVGPQLTYRAAIGYDVTPLLGIFGEVVGSATFTDQSDEHNIEWRLGTRILVDDFEIDVAGGTGITGGAGTPLFRVVSSFSWAPVRIDTDGDGVLDRDDACPADGEDQDGFADEDGCPDPDNDEDGRLDADDPCPDEPEDIDQFEDEDGCPERDNDQDGILDGYDSCPLEPEDIDNDRDEDGCPDNDTDRDGIPDNEDACVDEPEDFDGNGDTDGCPESDADDDGVPDELDDCPMEPEDHDDFEDQDGCPEEGSPPRSRRRRR